MRGAHYITSAPHADSLEPHTAADAQAIAATAYTQNSHLQLVWLFVGINMLSLFPTICQSIARQVQTGATNLARHGKAVVMLSSDHLLPLARHLVWATLMPSMSVLGRPFPPPWPVGAWWRLLIRWQFMFRTCVRCWHDVPGQRAADGSTGWGWPFADGLGCAG